MDNTQDALRVALERIANGQVMTGEFTHAETVLCYQEIARKALSAAPASEQQPMMDEQIADLWDDSTGHMTVVTVLALKNFARALLAQQSGEILRDAFAPASSPQANGEQQPVTEEVIAKLANKHGFTWSEKDSAARHHFTAGGLILFVNALLAQQAAELEQMRQYKDAAYLERNQVVAALAKCFPSGVAKTAIEGWSEDWHGCVYIDLPTGQASWHFHDSQAYLFDGLPPYTKSWDGHDTPEKYRRLALLARQAADSSADLPLLPQTLPGVLLPVAPMAGAEWNILDATGARVIIAGSLERDKWETNPALAAALVEMINCAAIAAQSQPAEKGGA